MKESGRASGAASGIAVTGVAQIGRILLGFASTIILSRLLAPSDFGIVAMMMPAVALVGLVQDLGLGQATIQKDRLKAEQVDALFWLSFALSVLLAFLLALMAPLFADFYETPEVEALAYAFACLLVVWNLQSQPSALLARQMRFGALAKIDLLAAIAGFVAGVATAYFFRTYWALFIAMLATGLSGVVMTWLASGFRPQLPRKDRETLGMIGFGSSISGHNIFNFLERNADNILIGRFHDAAELGLYDRAYRLLLFPLQQVRNPVSRVMVPFLSRTREEPTRYAHGYRTCLTGLLAIVHPAVLTAVIFSEDVFRTLLGERWVDAAPIFFWLGLAGLHQIATSSLSWLFLSQGRGLDYLMVGGASAVISVSAFLIGLSDGALGVARAYAIADLAIKMPLVWIVATRSGPVGLPMMLKWAFPHIIALSVTAAVLMGISENVDALGIVLLTVVTLVAFGVHSLVLMLMPQSREIILQQVEQRLNFRRRAS